MRKTLSLVLALLLLLCMGACGETEQPADSSSSHAGLSSVVIIESEDEASEEEAPQPEAIERGRRPCQNCY